MPWFSAVDFFVQGGKRGQRLCALLEEHDGLDDVGIVVMVEVAAADLARGAADGLPARRTRREQDRHAVVLGDDDVAHVVDRVQQADAADVDALAADGEVVAAGVGIAVGDGVDDLGHGDAVGEELAGIDFSLILARGSAEGGDVDDAGDLFDLANEQPVLRGLELVERITGAGRADSDKFRRPAIPARAAAEDCWAA